MGPEYKLCAVKEVIKKTKPQPTEWERIFANDATTRDFIWVYIYIH